MANLRMLWDNLWSASAGTLVASTSASALPAGATQNSDRTYVWRSLSQIDGHTLTRDLGAAQAVTGIALASVKLQNGGALKLYEGGSGATPGAWALVATLPAEDSETRVAYAFFNQVTARHWKLEWTNGTPAVAGYAEAGYIHLGGYFEFSKGVVVPVPIARSDPSVGRASVDGQESYVQRSGRATGAFVHHNAPEADLTTVRSIYKAAGRRTPIFAVLDTTVGWQAWLLRFTSDINHPRRVVPGRYDISYSWREAV